jgi:hypothetical protein
MDGVEGDKVPVVKDAGVAQVNKGIVQHGMAAGPTEEDNPDSTCNPKQSAQADPPFIDPASKRAKTLTKNGHNSRGSRFNCRRAGPSQAMQR